MNNTDACLEVRYANPFAKMELEPYIYIQKLPCLYMSMRKEKYNLIH
jgi:hypothetical protein